MLTLWIERCSLAYARQASPLCSLDPKLYTFLRLLPETIQEIFFPREKGKSYIVEHPFTPFPVALPHASVKSALRGIWLYFPSSHGMWRKNLE